MVGTFLRSITTVVRLIERLASSLLAKRFRCVPHREVSTTLAQPRFFVQHDRLIKFPEAIASQFSSCIPLSREPIWGLFPIFQVLGPIYFTILISVYLVLILNVS